MDSLDPPSSPPSSIPPPPSSIPPPPPFVPPPPFNPSPSLPPRPASPRPIAPPSVPMALPAGYIAYDPAVSARPTRGLSRAMLVVYWCGVASIVLVAATIFNRKSVVGDVINGTISRQDTTTMDNRARAYIVIAIVIQVGMMIAGGVITAIYSRRVVTNAVAAGVRGLSPNRATWGWFVPFAWWAVGFNQLRSALEGAHHDARAVRQWQVIFIASSAFSWITRNIGNSPHSLSALANGLQAQGLLTAASAGVLAFAAWRATTVVRALETAFSPAA